MNEQEKNYRLQLANNLATNQLLWWEFTEHNKDFFVLPNEIIKYINFDN